MAKVLSEFGTLVPAAADGEKADKSSVEAIVNVYGSKNLLGYPYADTTKTENGLTLTDNGDGSITVSGTASADTYFSTGTMVLDVGTYIMSGCPSGGDATKYFVRIDKVGSSSRGTDIGSGVTVTITEKASYSIYFCIKSGQNFSPAKTFYPMIRDARITDDTFVPYAMTNRELTQEKADKTDISSILATGSTNTTGATITKGTYFYLNGALVKAKADIANGASYTENTNYEAVTVGGELKTINSNTLGAGTSLSSNNSITYTSSNPFTPPADGYVSLIHFKNDGTVDTSFIVKSGNITLYKIIKDAGTTDVYDFIYVKKGIPMYVYANGGTTVYTRCTYYPFV